MNYKKIFSYIDKKNIISFDVFDTLLCRKTYNPRNVFQIIEKKFNNHFSCNYEFLRDRVFAEYKARENMNGIEIEFDDIYKFFPDKYNSDMIEWLKKFEIIVENKVLYRNDFVYPIYEYAKSKNKTIIIITDMYLNETIIANKLSECGYEYDKIYVSSTIKKTKRDGSLFKFVLDDLDCESKDVIHFGDSLRSDFINARKNNIFSYHLHKSIKLDKNINDFDDLCKILNTQRCINKNENFNIGYKILGPLYVSFSIWLYSQLKSMDINKLFFLSRDGKIMKRSFDIMFNDIKTEYFYLSRRSIIVPALYFVDEYSEFLDLMNFKVFKEISLKLIKEKIGLENINLSKIQKKFGFTDDSILQGNQLISNQNFKNFYEEIKDIIKENSKFELDNFNKYLNKLNFNGKVAIVDIGWQGTMQKALTLICHKMCIDVEIIGFYYGLKHNNLLNSNTGFGYIFNQSNDDNYTRLFSFGGLFEYFFSCEDGSVMKYDNGNPILAINEYENTDYLSTLIEIQNGGIQFVNESNSMVQLLGFNQEMLKNYSLENLFNFGCKPNLSSLSTFNKLYYNNIENFYLLPQHSLIYYLFHLKKFKSDLNHSFWKIGFMKKLFKIRLPYLFIYSKFKK